MAPDQSRNQGHVDDLVGEFDVFLQHEVEQLFCELLRTVDNINGHKILPSSLDLFLPKPLGRPFLLLLNLLLLVLRMFLNPLHNLNIGRVNQLILITVLHLLKRLSSRNQKMRSNHAYLRRLVKAPFRNNIDRTVISPDVTLVEVDHHLKTFLGHLIRVFDDILVDEVAEFLVYFYVLVMLVHAPDVVQNVLVEDFAELFVLDVEEGQQKLDGLHWVQDIFGS